MAGIPTVVVSMASPDGSSGWVDVSDFVDLARGVRCARGRTSEFETSAPGTASFTLINKNTAWGYTWRPGGYFDIISGILVKNALVKIAVAGSQVWYGRVDSFKSRGSSAKESTLEVSCTDAFKTYAKARLYPWAIETCKADVAWSSGAVYPIGRRGPIGSYRSAHRDSSASLMRLWRGSVGGFEINEDGPPHVKYAMKINPRAQIGPVLEHPTTWNPGATYGLVSFWFRTEADETSYLWSMQRTSGGSGYAAIWINATTGRLTFTCAGDSGGSVTTTPTSAAASDLFDGDWHHVAAWFYPTSGTAIKAFIDGSAQSIVNSGGTACTIGSGNRRAVFGGKRDSAWAENSYSLNGDIALPAIWTHSGTSNAPADWYDDGMTGATNMYLATRTAALADFIGVTAPTVADTTGYALSGQDLTGKSYLDAIQQIADSEMGMFFIDRAGLPQLRGYAARDSSASVVLTLNATQDLQGDVEFVLDDGTYANVVKATSEEGSRVARNGTLVTADGAEIVEEWDTLTYDETELATMASNRLAMRSSNDFRLGRITVDLMTTPNSIGTTTLTLDPLDRVRVSSLDADIFGATTYDGFVEGWELNVSTDEYAVSLDLSPVI